MWEKILIGFIGAALALLIIEIFDRYKQKAKAKIIASLAVKHLGMIKRDLVDHFTTGEKKATFGKTQYCEAVVGDFLYDLITSNIECFSSASSVEKSIEFFHTYKVNMAKVKARLNNSTQRTAILKTDTYKNLLSALDGAINELSGIANA